jgi:ABC-type lipoprotein export system ATPase subunit
MIKKNQKLKVLSNINIFKLLKEKLFPLIGPSGTGKSTLLNIAGLLEKPFDRLCAIMIGINCNKLSMKMLRLT